MVGLLGGGRAGRCYVLGTIGGVFTPTYVERPLPGWAGAGGVRSWAGQGQVRESWAAGRGAGSWHALLDPWAATLLHMRRGQGAHEKTQEG